MLADLAQVVVGIASVGVAAIALTVALRQWELQRRADKTALAREAADKFFSEQIAEVRYSLYDTLVQTALAARGEPGQYFDRLRQAFGVGASTYTLPARYALITRWAREPAGDAEEQRIRDCFERDSAVLSATFDSILRAAETCPEAAEHIQRRLGRVLAWWMLVWPGAFDHTNSFMAQAFLRDGDVRHYDPADSACTAYTSLWWRAPLWSDEQWRGAVANYRSLAPTMFPGDPWAEEEDDSAHRLGEGDLRHARDPARLPMRAS
jgi:hypothetical protein